MIKTALILLIMLVTSPAQSHGGISAMHGMGEGFSFLGMAVVTLSTWLTFVAIIIFKKELTHKFVKTFRLTLYGLILFLYLIMGFWVLIAFSFAWEVMLFVVPFSIIMIGLTELVVFMARKKIKNQRL